MQSSHPGGRHRLSAAGFRGHKWPISNTLINRPESLGGGVCVCVCVHDHVHGCIFMNACVVFFLTSGGSPCGLSEKMLCGHTGESFTV